MKHIKNTIISAKNDENCQCKQENIIHITNHSKNENHVKNSENDDEYHNFHQRCFTIKSFIARSLYHFYGFENYCYVCEFQFVRLSFFVKCECLLCWSFLTLCFVAACLFFLCFWRSIHFLIVVLLMFVQTM